MTEIICRYSKDRDQAIVSYLYDDDGGFDVAERVTFEAHLATCDRCRVELARYKVPEEWIFVDHLPRNAMGKVLKGELRVRVATT